MFAARRARLALMQGQWAQAEAALRDLLDGQDDPGMIGRETVPVLARVLVRQGSADAQEWLAPPGRPPAPGGGFEGVVAPPPGGPSPGGGRRGPAPGGGAPRV